ncbi:Major facilitator superfamily domain-containing protein 12 [Halocaridina rubra]|uniref:Major facilitator superfamily domain-containing protein 12 n=1 Tax=Halocaridina rubra TaxID=373956 RepID=A0AAN8WZG8_HALRR
MKEALSRGGKLCYGVGHVMNDLCAAMWFSYILLFYSKVLEFDASMAGVVMLVGQLADGLSTPVVGILADKENKIPICARYGRRKVWHLIGTIFIAISFPFIFNACLGCEDASEGARLGFHLVFVCIFQFGWACVQISHLALIPDLTSKKSQRTELNSIRYAFMVLANLTVFVITFIILGIDAFDEDDGESGGVNLTTTAAPLPDVALSQFSSQNLREASSNGIGPSNLHNFRDIALICIGIGLITSIIFHVGTKEPAFKPSRSSDYGEGDDSSTKKQMPKQKMRKRDWFKELPFYQIGAMYTFTRLYVNLYQTYITLFVDGTLMLDSIFIALVPLCMHFSSFLGSLVMKPINTLIGRKRTFALGCCVGLAACVWIGFGKGDYFSDWGIFLVAALLGIGGSTLLITSLSITADLIGDNSEGGAFVYGFMSLLDKLSNGIVIMIVQNLDPEDDGASPYYRRVLSYACGVPCVLGVLITLTLMKTRVGARRRGASIAEIMSTDDCSQDNSENPKVNEKATLADQTIISQKIIPDIKVETNGLDNLAFVNDSDLYTKAEKRDVEDSAVSKTHSEASQANISNNVVKNDQKEDIESG